ncbi:MAG: Flp pilus assembly protein CpaB [Nitratireductor sp.]
MKVARLAILGFAVVTAGGAGMLALKMAGQKPEKEIVIQKAEVKAEQVLVAEKDIAMGSTITPESMKWQNWPMEGVGDGFITKSARPDAITDLEGSIARAMIFSAEPIRDAKIVQSDTGFLSAILPKGMRAVATEIDTSTSAGGFILPNDRVDVLMTEERSGEGETGYRTQVILRNIRILAIDQIIEDSEGNSSVVGETATLQLTPKQVEILAIAQETADRISLSLRSIADNGEKVSEDSEGLYGGSRGAVRVIKYGRIKEQDTSKRPDEEIEGGARSEQ